MLPTAPGPVALVLVCDLPVNAALQAYSLYLSSPIGHFVPRFVPTGRAHLPLTLLRQSAEATNHLATGWTHTAKDATRSKPLPPCSSTNRLGNIKCRPERCRGFILPLSAL